MTIQSQNNRKTIPSTPRPASRPRHPLRAQTAGSHRTRPLAPLDSARTSSIRLTTFSRPLTTSSLPSTIFCSSSTSRLAYSSFSAAVRPAVAAGSAAGARGAGRGEEGVAAAAELGLDITRGRLNLLRLRRGGGSGNRDEDGATRSGLSSLAGVNWQIGSHVSVSLAEPMWGDLTYRWSVENVHVGLGSTRL